MSKEQDLNKVDNQQLNIAGVMRPSFWFMTDMHTFIKPKGDTVKEIKKNLMSIAKENAYGMVCPVIILEDEKEIRRVGVASHVDGKGNVDLSAWYKEIMKDVVVRSYDGA